MSGIHAAPPPGRRSSPAESSLEESIRFSTRLSRPSANAPSLNAGAAPDGSSFPLRTESTSGEADIRQVIRTRRAQNPYDQADGRRSRIIASTPRSRPGACVRACVRSAARPATRRGRSTHAGQKAFAASPRSASRRVMSFTRRPASDSTARGHSTEHSPQRSLRGSNRDGRGVSRVEGNHNTVLFRPR